MIISRNSEATDISLGIKKFCFVLAGAKPRHNFTIIERISQYMNICKLCEEELKLWWSILRQFKFVIYNRSEINECKISDIAIRKTKLQAGIQHHEVIIFLFF